MLTLENVSVNYGAIEALTDISLTVNQGEVVTLIGANGAGKTTTLRTITGLLQPKNGRVIYEGKEISPEKFRDKVRIFFLIYFAMTGLHALHMIIGLAIMTWLLWKAWRGTFTSEFYAPVEVTGLYWHFVDIVWIFLFSLLYLLGRHFGGGH